MAAPVGLRKATSQRRSSITPSPTIVSLITYTARSRTTALWPLPAPVSTAASIGPSGTRSAAARADTLRPIHEIRKLSTPAPTAGRSRVTITTPDRRRTLRRGRSIPLAPLRRTRNIASNGPSPLSFRRTARTPCTSLPRCCSRPPMLGPTGRSSVPI